MEFSDRLMGEEKVDLVAVSRKLSEDADWAKKIIEASEIKLVKTQLCVHKKNM